MWKIYSCQSSYKNDVEIAIEDLGTRNKLWATVSIAIKKHAFLLIQQKRIHYEMCYTKKELKPSNYLTNLSPTNVSQIFVKM